MVTDGFNSSRTTSSYSCQDCLRDREPGEVAGLEKRMLVDAESPVDVDTALWRRGESSHSSISSGYGLMALNVYDSRTGGSTFEPL